MATLTPAQLAELRRGAVRELRSRGRAVDYDKPTINASFQSIEDWIVANFAELIAATPGPFSSAEKRWLIAYYLHQRAERELS